ncbi:variable surface protein Vir27-like, truncated, partial [Plasmodium vivax]
KDDLEELESKFLYYNRFIEANELYCSNGFPYDEIKKKIKRYVNDDKISEELVNGICSFNIQKVGQFCNTLCDYFYYWIGDKIYNLVSNENDFTETINTLYTELSRYAKEDKCKCNSKHETNENFKKIKIAYDYSNDYETIKEHLETNNNMCDADYNKYLNNAVEAYNSVREDCNKDIQPQYCIQLTSFISDFFENTLSPLQCDLRNVHREVQRKHSSSSTEFSVLGDPPAIPPHEDMPEDGASISATTDTVMPEIKESISVPTDKYMSKIITNVSFPIGAASTMLLLYKFTPVGSFFRRNLGKNKVMDQTMNSSMIGAIGGYIYNNDQTYLGRHRYNLSYSPE